MNTHQFSTDKFTEYLKRFKWVAFLFWVGLILILLFHWDKLSSPEALVEARLNSVEMVLLILLLFAVKSLSVVLYSGILYAATGLLFPYFAAVLINLVGTAIMVTLPYFIGRKIGSPLTEYIGNKYPKVLRIRNFCLDNPCVSVMLLRLSAMLPSDIISLYMGSIRTRYRRYLPGCILGTLPTIFTFPILGTQFRTPGSPAFLISLFVQTASTVCAIYMCGKYLNK